MSKSKKKKLKLKKMMKKEDFESNLKKLKDEVEEETTEDKKEDFFKAAEAEEAEEAAEDKKEKIPPKKKTDKTSVDTGIITVKMLAREFKINSHQLRKILRTNFERKDQSRWEWKEGDKELEKIRKLLSKD